MKNIISFKVFGLAIFVAMISFLTTKTILNQNSSTIQKETTVYDRVLKTGVIRAAYIVYPPTSIKNPNTGEMSGVFIEALNKAAENMGLKVDWNTEVTWGEMIEGLNSNRYDIVGSAAWSNSTRGKGAEFVRPLYYSALNAYVRANDERFKDDDFAIANNKNFKVVYVDGQTSQILANKFFPDAQKLSLPQAQGSSIELLSVVDNKADMAFIETAAANEFIKNNPGKIKNASIIKPLVVYGNSMMVKKGEFKLKTMLDSSMDELLANGYIDSLIDKYEKLYSKGFYRVAVPYIPNK